MEQYNHAVEMLKAPEVYEYFREELGNERRENENRHDRRKRESIERKAAKYKQRLKSKQKVKAEQHDYVEPLAFGTRTQSG
jgi:hypothetical protein